MLLTTVEDNHAAFSSQAQASMAFESAVSSKKLFSGAKPAYEPYGPSWYVLVLDNGHQVGYLAYDDHKEKS